MSVGKSALHRMEATPMAWQTLIDAKTLQAELGMPWLVVVDCRSELLDPAAGERAYAAGHIPGARYASLDRDLSDLSRKGRGRHPLPESEAFCETLMRWGITPAHRVVAYDADTGMYAARLWWLMRLLGHSEVAVLDGGLAAWQAIGGALDRNPPKLAPRGAYKARFAMKAVASTAVVAARMAAGNGLLIDARAPERFRGEYEPIDRRAGHIPGAVNRPLRLNLDEQGHFLPAEQLRRQFDALLDGMPPSETVLMCGSGVTACHNLLAMTHAGLPGARVYAGSFSEWIEGAARPVATGE